MPSLKRAIAETKEFLQLNRDPDADDEDALDDLEDALDDLMGECGKGPSGSCSLAGTEYCDWNCPFS